MRREYSENKKRANRKYRQKKSEERRQANGGLPGKQNPFIAKSEALEKSIQLPNGTIIDAQYASDDDFYCWFWYITERIVEAVQAQGKHVVVIRRVQQDFQRHKYELDDEARWFFILEIYRLAVCQQSGMSMFVATKAVAS